MIKKDEESTWMESKIFVDLLISVAKSTMWCVVNQVKCGALC
jgi:hypothetical protein